MSLGLHLLPRAAAPLAVALFLVACRNGNDPVSTAPRGVIAASKGDTIVTMNIDGSNQKRFGGVPSIAQYGQHPAWFDRGHVLVHTVTTAGGAGVRLHSLDLATGQLSRVSPTSSTLVAEWYPRASGAWVYFMGETSAGTFEAWRVRANGAEFAKVPLSQANLGNVYRPVLSPDGSKLAVSAVVGGTIGVIVVNASTGAPVSPWVSGSTAPRWSPDGRRVAFSTPGGGRIREMAADGSGLRTIADGPFGEWFDWSAAGNWVVVADADGLTLVRASNGADRRPVAGTRGMWQPTVIAELDID